MLPKARSDIYIRIPSSQHLPPCHRLFRYDVPQIRTGASASRRQGQRSGDWRVAWVRGKDRERATVW